VSLSLLLLLLSEKLGIDHVPCMIF
jgi:hypothetical protein